MKKIFHFFKKKYLVKQNKVGDFSSFCGILRISEICKKKGKFVQALTPTYPTYTCNSEKLHTRRLEIELAALYVKSREIETHC